MKTDCIYYGGVDYDTNLHICKCSGYLDNSDTLCEHCKLWDNYIPNDSSDEEIKKAIKWQHMDYEEQELNSYEEYFKN